jgi:hypothetical protein
VDSERGAPFAGEKNAALIPPPASSPLAAAVLLALRHRCETPSIFLRPARSGDCCRRRSRCGAAADDADAAVGRGARGRPALLLPSARRAHPRRLGDRERRRVARRGPRLARPRGRRRARRDTEAGHPGAVRRRRGRPGRRGRRGECGVACGEARAQGPVHVRRTAAGVRCRHLGRCVHKPVGGVCRGCRECVRCRSKNG